MRKTKWNHQSPFWLLKDESNGFVYAFVMARPDPGGARPTGWRSYDFEINIPGLGALKGSTGRSFSGAMSKIERLLELAYFEFDGEEFKVIKSGEN